MTTLGGCLCAAIVLLLAASARSPPSRRFHGGRPRRRPPRGRERDRVLDDAMAEMLDLFVVTTQAGFAPLETITVLEPLVHPLLQPALRSVLARVSRGERLSGALVALSDVAGTRAATLIATLTAGEQSGLPLVPVLDRLADDARQHRRRVAETEARRLPVRLSFPLVTCTLPSFVLIAVVPLLLGALSSLAGG